MFGSFLKKSIVKRLLYPVFLIYLFIAITVTAIHMYIEYKHVEKTVAVDIDNLKNIVSDVISELIWNYNLYQIKVNLDGMLKNSILEGIKIEVKETGMTNLWKHGYVSDENNENIFIYDVLNNTSKSVNTTLFKLLPYKFPLVYTKKYGTSITIGSITFFSSTGVLFNKLKVGFSLIIINSILKTTLLWILLLWGGYLFISKPLRKINNALHEISKDKLNSTTIYIEDKYTMETEVGSVIEQFNEMSKQLKLSRKKIMVIHDRMSSVINLMPSALIVLAEKNIILDCNLQALNFAREKNIIGKSFSKVFAKYGFLISMVNMVLNERKIQETNRFPLSINGETNFYNILVYPVTSDIFKGIVVKLDDISAQVYLEQSMIQNDRLKNLGVLMAGIVHELKNPLSGIMQSSQAIQRRLDPNLNANLKCAEEIHCDFKDIMQYVEKRKLNSLINGIRDSCQRGQNIINNVLLFSRNTTSDNFTFENPVLLINKALNIFKSDIEIKKRINSNILIIDTNAEDKKTKIECLPSELEQVFLNLLNNAAYALTKGKNNKSQKIKINLSYFSEHILYEIIDNGSGISKENLKHLFGAFFTTKPIGVGTGLGLSISSTIINEKHNGKLDCTSIEGEGTTFKIELPYKQSTTLENDSDL